MSLTPTTLDAMKLGWRWEDLEDALSRHNKLADALATKGYKVKKYRLVEEDKCQSD